MMRDRARAHKRPPTKACSGPLRARCGPAAGLIGVSPRRQGWAGSVSERQQFRAPSQGGVDLATREL